MKVFELMERLIGYENFEVEAIFNKADSSKTGYAALHSHNFKVGEIADIGYSEKTIVLDLEEK